MYTHTHTHIHTHHTEAQMQIYDYISQEESKNTQQTSNIMDLQQEKDCDMHANLYR